jgi:hypothetical protein
VTDGLGGPFVLVFDGFGDGGPWDGVGGALVVGGADVVVGGADVVVVGGAWVVVGGGGSAFLLMPAGFGNGTTLVPSRAAFM